jgi:uncharacterized protein (DUF885 family)
MLQDRIGIGRCSGFMSSSTADRSDRPPGRNVMRYVSCLLFAFVVATTSACARDDRSPAPTAADVESETTRINQWFDARYEESLQRHPLATTTLGRKDNYDRIDDFTESAEDAELAWWRGSVADLKSQFRYDALGPEAKISHDLWMHQFEQIERAAPFRRRDYVFTQMQGVQASLPTILINFHRVDDAGDMEAYIARIGAVATAVDQLLERARLAAGEGVRPPAFAYEEVITQARAQVTGAPFGGRGNAPLWADATAKIGALETAGTIDANRAASLRAAAREAMVSRFKPSYDALIAWMARDKVSADVEPAGVWKLPEGRAYYAQRLGASTTTGMTADEIHRIGLAEVARIRGEMEAIRQSVGFAGTLQAFFSFVRDDARFYFPNTDAGRDGYLQASRDYLAAIERRLPEFFGLRPKAALLVKRVEPFREQDGAAQHYMRGTPDGSRPGVYYAHLSDMTSMPKSIMEAVAYHEGSPGHHMQLSIAQELQGLPVFRTQAGGTAYIEGWGLYAEQLAKEMGGYQDPYSEFGRLSSEIWRAIRLVVDTGLHDKEWTEAQAVAYFKENSPIADGQIRSEVRRYLVMPGQATAYKIGMLKFLELRDRARARLGARFDIRAFHDAVLGGGPLPLSVLERRVDDWMGGREGSEK